MKNRPSLYDTDCRGARITQMLVRHQWQIQGGGRKLKGNFLKPLNPLILPSLLIKHHLHKISGPVAPFNNRCGSATGGIHYLPAI